MGIVANQPDAAQCTDTVLMVRPANFAANPETASSNAFQGAMDLPDAAERALAEFDAAVAGLRAAGVTVVVIEDIPAARAPDAVFPNNWFSTHADGTVVLYPMQAVNRRRERRLDVFDRLRDEHGRRTRRLLDLSFHETRGTFLEGTGSLVLDRAGRVAFACRSPRTDARLLEEWAAELGYAVCLFDAVDSRGQAIYHTNVMMGLGTRFAVVALDCVPEAQERDDLAERLAAGGREVIDISPAQVDQFLGNLLELRDGAGRALVALSARAAAALEPAQRRALERHARLVALDIPTIETCGGGSVRCMLAEVFLPTEVSDD